MFKNLSLVKKGLAIIVLNSLVLVVAGGLLSSKTDNIQNIWQDYQSKTVVRQTYLMNIKSQFGYGGFIHNFKNYVLRGQPKYKDRFDKNAQDFRLFIASFRAIPLSNEEEKAIQDIEAVASQYIAAINTVEQLYANGKTATEIDQVVKINDSPAFEAFEMLSQQFFVDSAERSAEMQAALSYIITFGMIIFGAIFLLNTSSLLFLLIKTIGEPIERMVALIRDIAEGDGDLTVRLPVNSDDELGQLAGGFNQFVGKLQQTINKIKQSVTQIANASVEMTSTSEDLARGAEKQQSQLSSIAASIEEVNATIAEASRNTDTTRENARHANKVTQVGQTTVRNTVEGIAEIATIVQDSSAQIATLETRSSNIGTVVQVIEDIADQTNLLALNAAIEAARAGESGKGFAVVADEVRKLAERTVSATAEIGSMIKLIQTDVGATVNAMTLISDKSNHGQQLASEAGQMLSEISSSVENVSIAVSHIASSAGEQNIAVADITVSVESVSEVSSDAAAAAHQFAASSEELSREVQELNSLMRQFKV